MNRNRMGDINSLYNASIQLITKFIGSQAKKYYSCYLGHTSRLKTINNAIVFYKRETYSHSLCNSNKQTS